MKQKIEVDLLPVIGEHEGGFRTGDFIIVLKGVVLGVQYKEDFQALPPPPPLEVKPIKRTAPPKIHPPAVDQAGQHSPVEQDVLAAVRKLNEANHNSRTVDIGDVLSIERKDGAGRQLLSNVVRSMKLRGLLATKDDGRVPHYCLPSAA